MKRGSELDTDLVLIGSGHAHVQVLKSFGMRGERGVRLTLVAKEIEAPYSGMLPGYVAGHYDHDQIHIDVLKLARFAGARLIHGEVTGIDRESRRIAIAGRPPLAYDLLSIDVGITPETGGIAGAEHAISVKPVSTFAQRWTELLGAAMKSGGPRRFVVAGGGAAGLEIVLAMANRLRAEASTAGLDAGAFTFVIVSGTVVLPSHGERARRLARRALASRGVELIEQQTVAEVGPNFCRLGDGRRLVADAVLLTTKAAPARWFRASGLPCTEDGFLALKPTLQLLDDNDVFAAGDCGTVIAHPRAKAGVFAVRQGPPLTENLRLRARGKAARPFTPQKRFLTILSLGDRDAIAARSGLAVAGPWVWRWKDRIDREFMAKFQDLPSMQPEGGEMRCGGCAAKIGPAPLADALARLAVADPTGLTGADARDDAAIIERAGGRLELQSVDFFRAFWPDPYVFGEIAATHALGDIYAMGGKPEHALAIAMLPHAGGRLVAEDLFQLLAGARACLDREGVALVGGHSCEGLEMAAGFSVTGSVASPHVKRKGGLRPGDVLVLTKPLGTGILLAAEMRGMARSREVGAMLGEMRRSLASDVAILAAHGASAMTDVTGFGLAGHLAEMLAASGAAGDVSLEAVPLYSGASDLAAAGVASTLLPQNRKLADTLAGGGGLDDRTLAILLDPQTAGGLLAGVPEQAVAACIAALRAAGAKHATAIGRVVDGRPHGAPIRLLPGRVATSGLGFEPAVLEQ